MLLTRLQTARTDNYTYYLVYFFMYIAAVDVEGLTPDFLVGAVEQVQPQLWSQLLKNVVVPQLSKMLPKDRKVVIVGLTKLLIQSNIMFSEPSISQWPGLFSELAGLFTQSKHLQSAQSTAAEDPDEVLRSLDFEEQGAGYQAAYSKLAASESIPEDPVASITDIRAFVGEKLSEAVSRDPRIHGLIESSTVGPTGTVTSGFIQNLVSSGYQL